MALTDYLLTIFNALHTSWLIHSFLKYEDIFRCIIEKSDHSNICDFIFHSHMPRTYFFSRATVQCTIKRGKNTLILPYQIYRSL